MRAMKKKHMLMLVIGIIFMFISKLNPYCGFLQTPHFDNIPSAPYVPQLVEAGSRLRNEKWKRLRIAGMCRLWPTHKVGGMQGHAMALYTGLVQQGHEVHVFTSHHPDLSSVEEEVRGRLFVHYAPKGPPAKYSDEYFDWTREIILKYSSTKRFDIIHTESGAGRRFLGDTNFPTVVTWHGYGYEGWRSRINEKIMEGNPAATKDIVVDFEGEYEKMAGFQHHVAISHQAATDLISVMYLEEDRVHLILNGIDLGKFKASSAVKKSFREQNKIPDNAIVLGVGGKLTEMKGTRQLLDIVNILVQFDEFPIYICVAGVGPMLDEWKLASVRYGGKILVLGQQDPAGMMKFYQSIDIFVNPTAYYQGLDLTMQEAMASSVPILATHTGSIPSTIISKSDEVPCGETFALGNRLSLYHTIIKMSSDRQKLARQGAAARKKAVSDFSLHGMIVNYEKLFLELERKHNPRSWEGRLCFSCEENPSQSQGNDSPRLDNVLESFVSAHHSLVDSYPSEHISVEVSLESDDLKKQRNRIDELAHADGKLHYGGTFMFPGEVNYLKSFAKNHRGLKTVCETGFAGGHSALLWLSVSRQFFCNK